MNEKDYVRFIGYVDIVTNGRWICYEWLGKQDHRGYGRFWLNGRWQQAHRVSYQYISRRFKLRNSIRHILEEKPEIHHKCYNRACVRLTHLEMVTHKENHADRAIHYWKNKRKTTGGKK